MTATTPEPARPVYIAVEAPDAKTLEWLNFALSIVQCEMCNLTDKVIYADYDPEGGMYSAQAFAALSKLLVDLKYARPVQEPKPVPAPFALPFLGVVSAGDPPAEKKPPTKPVKRRKPAAATKAVKRFDYVALPPRVEAGC